MKHLYENFGKKEKLMLRRLQAMLLVLCIVLTSLNLNAFATLAESEQRFALGPNKGVIGILKDGVLTISGAGDTYNYSLEEPSPLTYHADDIKTVVIREGITHLGSYLFYDCNNLSGRLTIPASVVSVGDCAFSGERLETAPSLHYIENLFDGAELVIEDEELESKEQSEGFPGKQEDDNGVADETATSSNAKSMNQAKILTRSAKERMLTTSAFKNAARTEEKDVKNKDVKSEDTKTEDTKTEGTKTEDTKTEDTKTEDTKTEDTKTEDTKTEGTKTEDTKTEDTKTEDTKTEDKKTEGTKTEDTKTEDTKTEDTKTEDTKTEENGESGTKETKADDTEVKETEAKENETKESEADETKVNETKADETGSKENETKEADDTKTEENETKESELGGSTAGGTTDGTTGGTTGGSTAKEQETEDEEEDLLIEGITEQQIGTEIFYPGQQGAFLCAEGNASFFAAMEEAGYLEITGYSDIFLSSRDNESMTYEVPVTEEGILLPGFDDSGFTAPTDPKMEYVFIGWTEIPEESEADLIVEDPPLSDEAEEEQETEDILEAYSLYTGESLTFEATYKTLYRTRTDQKISTMTSDGLLVEITGNLPDGAEVIAETVEAETAAGMAGDLIPDPKTVVAALDISILVEGNKFQPSDYGKNVKVKISNVNAAPAQDQSLSILHISEEAESPEAAVEVMEPEAEEEGAVAFEAEHFSVYIVTLADNYQLTFGEDKYTLLDVNGNSFEDENTGEEGIQVTTSGAFLRFKIQPDEGYVLTDVKVVADTASGGIAAAALYGPFTYNTDSSKNKDVYIVSKVTAATGNQRVTVQMEQAYTVTYNLNGGTPTSPIDVTAPGGTYKAAYPAELAALPPTSERFVCWNTAADGNGISYAPADTLTINAPLTLYAIWSKAETPFKAILYEDGTDKAYTELTEGGAVASPWEYTSTRYLEITPKNIESVTSGFTIAITLPAGIALASDGYTKADGNKISSVTFEKLTGAGGSQGQGTGRYANEKTGTLTYTFTPTADDTNVVRIPIIFDQKLWDKEKKNGNLSGDYPPVIVTMKIDGVSYTKTISNVEALRSFGDNGINLSTGYNPKYVSFDQRKRVPMHYTDIRYLDCWESITVEYTLPHKGEQYAKYLGELTSEEITANGYYKPASMYPPGDTTCNIDVSDPSKVIYTWDESDFNQNFLYLAPVVDLDGFQDGDTLEYRIKFTGVSLMGSIVTREAEPTPFVLANRAIISLLQTPAKVHLLEEDAPADILDNLGSMGIANKGFEDSEELQMTYKFDTDHEHVYAIQLPSARNDGSKELTAACWLSNGSETKEVTAKLPNCTDVKVGAGLTARKVAEDVGLSNADKWYFEKIVYEIASIPKSTEFYDTNNPKKIGYAGNIYGKKVGNAVATNTLTVKKRGADGASWVDLDAGEGGPLTQKSTVTYSSDYILNTFINSLSVDGKGNGASTNIRAGTSVRMKAELMMYQYPYGSSQYTCDPMVCFVAPEGVSISEDSVTAAWSDGSTDVIKPRLVTELREDDATIYRILFDGTAAFGGPRLGDSGLISPEKVRHPVISMTLNTKASMKSLEVKMIEQFFVTDENGSVTIGYGKMWDAEDKHNLNYVLSPANSRVGAYKDPNPDTTTAKMKINIEANANRLDFSGTVRRAGETAAEWKNGENSPVYLSEKNNQLEYRVALNNNSIGIVAREDFYYYIPIPRQNVAIHEHMMNVKQDKPQYSLELTGPVKIAGDNPQIYEIRYSTNATKENYSNGKANFETTVDGKDYAVYYTADEITKDKKISWSDVNMCKLIAVADYVPNSTKDYFTLTMEYQGTEADVIAQAGDTAVWGSCGYQKYDLNGVATAAHTPTGMVSAMLRYEKTETVLLKAEKNTATKNTSTKTVPLAEFKTGKTLSIQEITPYNVTLETADTVLLNMSTAPGSTADSNYSISVGLDDPVGANKKELAAGIGQILGTTKSVDQSGGSPSELQLTLINYDRLRDITTDRRVTVVLGDGEGVEITLNLTVERTATPVGDPKLALDAGKRYELIESDGSTITVTNNSAVTVQYVNTVLPDNYTGQSLELTDSANQPVNFPSDVSVTMLDLTDAAHPDYYYKSIETGNSSALPLSSFANMSDGSTPPSKTYSSGSKQTLVFIIDFEKGHLEKGNYQLSLSATDVSATEKVDFTVTESRSFKLSAAAGSTMSGDSLPVAGMVTVSTPEGLDTGYQHKKMALEVILKDASGNEIKPPAGALISMGGKLYTPTDGAYILPLGSLESGEYSYTFSTPHTYLDKKAYKLCTRLIVSSTSDDTVPCGGTVVGEADVTFTADPPLQYALTVEVINEENTKLFTSTQAAHIKVKLTTNAAACSYPVTLELQRKTGGVYVTETDMVQEVTGTGGTWSQPINGIMTNTGRTNEVSEVDIHLSKDKLEAGKTYRLLFKVTGVGTHVISVPYNIVIVADQL